jgi:hypothetical protein
MRTATSGIGTSRTWRRSRLMSAPEGKADLAQTWPEVRY